MTRPRIIVADDHPVVLHGLTALLAGCPDLQLIGQYADGLTALAAIRDQRPDVAVVDIQMPNLSGIELLTRLRKEELNTKVILLTASVADDQIYKARQLGAHGIVLKDAAPETLVACVRCAAEGGQPVQAAMIEEALERERRRRQLRSERTGRLTARELDVARLVANGLATKQIANALEITEGTTRLHLHSIYQKLGVGDRVALRLVIDREGLPDRD